LKSTIAMKYICLFFFCLQLGFAQTAPISPVKAELTANKAKLKFSEKVMVEFFINAETDDFTPPVFKDFAVVSGPNTSSSSSFINGKKDFTTRKIYELSPLRTGILTIEPGMFKSQGEKVYKTNSLTITVAANPAHPNEENTGRIMVISEISNLKPYRNEYVMIKYKLYYDAELKAPASVRLLLDDNYKNYCEGQIDNTDLATQDEIYNGTTYKSLLLRTDIIRMKDLTETKMNGMIELGFNTLVSEKDDEKITKTTYKKVPFSTAGIQAHALPPYDGKERDCNVGQFSITTELPAKPIAANSNFQIKVIVEGMGLLEDRQANGPKLQAPASFTLVETAFDRDQYITDAGLSNKAIYTYTYKAAGKGSFEFPKPTFLHFDNKANAYVTAGAPGFTIVVE
jgi:hypothetical protein